MLNITGDDYCLWNDEIYRSIVLQLYTVGSNITSGEWKVSVDIKIVGGVLKIFDEE